MPYDAVKDFAPITLLATTPNMLVVNNDVPAKNLKDFIALGKKEGKMTFASSGSGTSIHVSGERFKTMTGIDMVHVPYKGRATAIPDVLGGRVTMMFDNMPSSLQLVREGKLRALGVTSAQRQESFPDLPAIGEVVKGFESTAWFGVFGPAKLPADITNKLNAAIVAALNDPEMRARLQSEGATPAGGSAADFAAFVRDDVAHWAPIVKAAGAKVE